MGTKETGPPQTQREKWKFVKSDKEYTVDRFYSLAVLPCVAMVTQGYYGDIGIDVIGLGQAIYIQKLSKQQRVVAEIISEKNIRHISIPTAYRARFCVVENHKLGTSTNEYPLAEILRTNKLPCVVRFSPHNQFNLMSVEGTKMATDRMRLRLLKTYDELYLVGNPISETTIFYEVMLLPFYLEELRLSLVTGIQGYPSTWSTYSQQLTVAKLPDSAKYGNTDIAVYRETGLESFEQSGVVPEAYLSISVSNDSTGHQYEDLQRKENEDKMYEIVWDWNTGRSVVREIEQQQKRADDRYIRWNRHKKLYPSLPRDAASRPERRYVERPLPKPPKTTDQETPPPSPNPKEEDINVSNPQSDMRKHAQRSQFPEASPNQAITPTEENHQNKHPRNKHEQAQLPDKHPRNKHEQAQLPDKHPRNKHEQAQLPSSQSHLRNELKSVLRNSTKLVREETPSIPPVDYDKSDLPPVPERPLKLPSQALLSQDMADQRRKLIPSMSVSDVGYWLGVLKLEQYVKTFKDNLVDGSILPDLDDDILQREFGMSRFHTVKLRKFLTEGYIPLH